MNLRFTFIDDFFTVKSCCGQTQLNKICYDQIESFTLFVGYLRCLVHKKIKSFSSYDYSYAYVHRIFI